MPMRENTPKLDKLIYVLPLLQSKSKMFTSDDKIKKPRGANLSVLMYQKIQLLRHDRNLHHRLLG